jgi:hypothetical protein
MLHLRAVHDHRSFTELAENAYTRFVDERTVLAFAIKNAKTHPPNLLHPGEKAAQSIAI